MKSTEKRILVFAFLILTGTVAVNTAFHLQAFRRIYFDGIILRCQSAANGLKTFAEMNLQRGLPLNVLQELDERCRQIVGNDPDLAYCLVEDELGITVFTSNRAQNFNAGIGPVTSLSTTTALIELPGFGRAFDFSQPLYGTGNRLIGRVRIGFAEEALQKHTRRLLQQALLVLSGALLSVFALVVFFTRKNLLIPIRRLSGVAREIAGGNLRIAIPSMSTSDFNELAIALREMSCSLEMREEAAAKGYRQLEYTNQLLRQANEQQEKTSSELSRSQKMHRVLFENASDAIVISDHEERILLFNRQAEKFFGISRDHALGCNLFEFAARIRGDVQAQRQQYAELLEKGRIESEIKFVRTGDEQPVIGWSSASVVHERKGKFWVQNIIRNITRETLLKENLEQSAQGLKRLNQMKDSFLGLASHELKTPLTVIVGYSDLLLNDASVSIDESVRNMVRHIADAAERLTCIVHDMVDVSMLDNCRLPMEIRPLDLNALLTQIVTASGHSLEQRKQQIALHLKKLPNIDCDAARLKQAFGNLLGNAIKFTPDGGRITVQSCLFEPAGGGEKKVEVLIADTGIGISDNDRDHIFEKFYEAGQIEEHFTGKVAFGGKGTGLGLTIAKGIIEMHGGRIWVESPGYDPHRCPGSVFHVLLPIHPPAGAKV
jgi:hypothetical protein